MLKEKLSDFKLWCFTVNAWGLSVVTGGSSQSQRSFSDSSRPHLPPSSLHPSIRKCQNTCLLLNIKASCPETFTSNIKVSVVNYWQKKQEKWHSKHLHDSDDTGEVHIITSACHSHFISMLILCTFIRCCCFQLWKLIRVINSYLPEDYDKIW